MSSSRLSTRIVVMIGLLFALFLTGCGSNSDDGTAPTPSDPASLQSRIDQIRQQSSLPGMAAAVISREAIDSAVSGIRKRGEPTPLARSDLFHLGSNIKAMSATLIAILVESGSLRWDSTIAEILPELAASMQPVYRSITIEQLLAHRSGVLSFTELADFALLPSDLAVELQSGSMAVIDQRLVFVSWLLQQPSPVIPGRDYLYSNAGYVVAAAMAERVTGESFEQLLRQRLLLPLDLQGRFGWPATGNHQQPWGHEEKNGVLQASDPDAPENQFPNFANPAGNISLSIDDYARFIQAHLRGLSGQVVLISPESYRKLHTPLGGAINNNPAQFYALGWGVIHDVNQNLSIHEGSAGTFDALAVIEPDRNQAVIILSNAYSMAVSAAVNKTAFDLLATTPP